MTADDWQEMDCWPYPPQGPVLLGRLPDGSEARVKFNPVRQCWVAEDGKDVARPTHWRVISE